jgi:hypothetical protein
MAALAASSGKCTLCIDKVDRQHAPRQGRWQHRLIGECDRRKMRAERLGDRNRVFGRDVVLISLASLERCNTISLIIAGSLIMTGLSRLVRGHALRLVVTRGSAPTFDVKGIAIHEPLHHRSNETLEALILSI